MKYQADSSMANIVSEEQIPVDQIYRISDFNTWALDFYNHHPVRHKSLKNIKEKKDIWIYVNDIDLRRVKDAGLDWDQQFTENDYQVSMLSKDFLNPSTRKRALKKMHLIHIR
ncbi:hypothetical protein ACU8V7_04795 [Zobellia nedashkovskayae]